MRTARAVALLLALAGIALLAAAFQRGEVRLGFLLVVPFVYGTGALSFLGVLLLMAAAVGFVASLVPPATDAPRVERHAGGVVLLGPIPIAWGADHRVQRWVLVAGAAILALWIALAALTRS